MNTRQRSAGVLVVHFIFAWFTVSAQPRIHNPTSSQVTAIPSNTSHSPTFALYQNRGQLATNIQYYTEATNPQTLIGSNTISFVYRENQVVNQIAAIRIDLSFPGNETQTLTTTSANPYGGYLNYFNPQTPQGGITHVTGFQHVICQRVLPNIDFQLSSGTNQNICYLVVHPGGSPSDIKLDFAGQDSLEIAPQFLRFLVENKKLTLPAAMAFQVDEYNNVTPLSWQPSFTAVGNDHVKLIHGPFDPTKKLVYQFAPPTLAQQPAVENPGNLEWSTYYGQNVEGSFTDVAVDSEGNQYYLGTTWSSVFPTTPGVQISVDGDPLLDLVLLKFDPFQQRTWATYYSTSQPESDPSLAVGPDDKPIMICTAQTNNIPIFSAALPPGAYHDSVFAGNGTTDVLIAKVSATGDSLLWQTFWGNQGTEQAAGIAVDNAGNIWVAADHCDSTSPTHYFAGAYNDSVSGNHLLAKFSSSYELEWASFYHGTPTSHIQHLTTDDFGRMYVTGWTGPGLPIVDPAVGAYTDTSYSVLSAGNGNAFIGCFTSANVLEWSTYVAGDDAEATHVSCDGKHLFATGSTRGSGFTSRNPVTNIQSVGSNTEIGVFAIEFDENHALRWGAWQEMPFGKGVAIQPAANGMVYLGGNDANADFVTFQAPGYYHQPTAVAWDNTITAFSVDRKRVWATNFGGDDIDQLNSMALFDNKLYGTGRTRTGDKSFPLWSMPQPAWNDSIKTFTGEFSPYIWRFNVSGADTLTGDTIVSTTAIADIEETTTVCRTRIGPNPAGSIVTIQGRINQLAIYDNLGRLILQNDTNPESDYHTLNLTGLPKGVLLVRLWCNEEISTVKIVHQ